ncbi:MAG TPA: oligosaccharide flippase family protein [Candidatus Fermentibacter sp.]|nr:oligosaccharide flippase family protein [Candidatus Fermentibacter sp.]
MPPDGSLLKRTARSGTARNAYTILAGQIAGKASFLVSMMLLSRLLSDSDLGSLMLAVAIAQIVVFLSDMGVSVVLNRKLVLSGRGGEVFLGPAFAARSVLWLAGSAILLAGSALSGYEGRMQTLFAILLLSAGLEAMCEQCFALFRARERMAWEAFSRVAGALSGLGVVLACFLGGTGLLVAAISFPVRNAVSLMVALTGQARLGAAVRLGAGWRRMSGSIVAESFAMGVTGLLFIVLQRVDSVVIDRTIGAAAVGAFQQCYRIADSLVFLVAPTLLPGALFPSLCRAVAGGRESAGRFIRRLSALFLAMALLTALPVALGGEWLLRLIWGPGYLRGLPPGEMGVLLTLTMATVPCFFLMHLTLTSLIAAGRQRLTVLPVACAIVLSAVSYYLLIPIEGLRAVPEVIAAVNILLALTFGILLHRGLAQGSKAAAGPAGSPLHDM